MVAINNRTGAIIISQTRNPKIWFSQEKVRAALNACQCLL